MRKLSGVFILLSVSIALLTQIPFVTQVHSASQDLLGKVCKPQSGVYGLSGHIGYVNGDPRFLCDSGSWYSCDPVNKWNFASKATKGSITLDFVLFG